MPKLTIDQREVEVPKGATILDAAQKLGIDIPTLCYRKECEPSTSCLVCMVRVGKDRRAVPSCATVAVDGMVVESESDDVRQMRRNALELLLSDHLGDCLGPCSLGCPAGMDIPTMLRQIATGDLHAAIATIKRDIALPAILGRICPAPCEKICRHGPLDQPVSICLLKRLAADVDFAAAKPYDPPCSAASGKHVAIVGAGPTGLSAAYYLRQHGHACTIFDEKEQPGGRLCDLPETDLPRKVLNLEIATIMRLGLTMQMGVRQDFAKLAELQKQFDAVLLACGATARDQAIQAKMPVSQRGIEVDVQTYSTPLSKKIFAAGAAVRSKAMVVRSVADGKEAAYAIHQFLSGQKVSGWPRPFNTKIGRMGGEELVSFAAGSYSGPRCEPAEGLAAGYSLQEGQEQASRCMHCDCRGVQTCKLREYAARYNADPHHFAVQRRRFESDSQHPEVVFESGKCIACGLCIQIAAAAGEPLGLTYVGRGFDVRVSAPFHQSIAQALTKAAADCVAACPTGALAFKNDKTV